MDENYLDSLLDEVSLDKEIDYNIEEELDSQMAQEKKLHQEQNSVSVDDLFNMDLEEDADASPLDNDLLFSEDQINELDQLDNLADLDMDELDFDDIDFNDLDITKIGDLDDGNIDNLLKDFDGDLKVADSFNEKSSIDEPAPTPNEEPTVNMNFVQETDGVDSAQTLNEDLNEDSFDTDKFLNSLLGDETSEDMEQTITDLPEPVDDNSEMDESVATNPIMNQENVTEESEEELSLEELLEESLKFEAEFGDAFQDDDVQTDVSQADVPQTDDVQTDVLQTDAPQQEISESQSEQDTELPEMDSLEDLFSLLDLEDTEDHTETEDAVETTDSTLEDMNNVLDNMESEEDTVEPKEKKKKGLMEILFGEPDEEDELSEEELQAIEIKKAEKKAKKQAAKEAKKEKAEAAKAEKAFKEGQKKKENDEKKRVKAEIKAKRKAEEKANAEPEKPLNRPAVIFIFSLFLGGTLLFYLASNNFNYMLAIENAAQFFSNQKYHNAYDEIKGVDVREKDQELKDRIYTVMYVERLYESYQNNMELGRPEKALDSLLRGVDKYYEHYEEAEELGILSDLEYSFNQIRTALETQYGITVEQALAINSLENYEYVQTIAGYVQGQSTPDIGEADNNDTLTADVDEEGISDEEQQEEEVE